MSRIIGIDVGGTNTNAALLEDGNLIATAQSPTDHHDLLSSAGAVLEKIMHSFPKQSQGKHGASSQYHPHHQRHC